MERKDTNAFLFKKTSRIPYHPGTGDKMYVGGIPHVKTDYQQSFGGILDSIMSKNVQSMQSGAPSKNQQRVYFK